MTLLRQFRFASFMLVLVGIIAFSIALVDFVQLFVAVVLATASWYVTEGPRGRTLPVWLANTLTVCALGWTAYGFLRDGELSGATVALGRFLLWLLIIKLYSPRIPSEERQRVALATMLVIAGCLESAQFAFGALVVLYAATAVWTAMLWRLHTSYEASRASRLAARGFAPPLEIAVGRRAAPQFRGVASTSILLIFVASAGVFVLFPRLPAILDPRGPSGTRSTAGFNDEIRLRGGDRISESRRELFTVRWVGPDREPILPARPLLLRGAVLDRYDPGGERWISARTPTGLRTVRTPPEQGFVRLGATDIGPASADARDTSFTATVEMRALATEVIFAPYAPVAVATRDSRSVSFDPTTYLMRDVSSNRASRFWSYSLRVQPQPSQAVLDELSRGAAESVRALDIPIEGIRVVADQLLARARATGSLPSEPAADASDAERYIYGREIARGIAGFMKRSFTYTTDLSGIVKVDGEDPIVSFLTRYRRGHCEYFASALCAVLRSLGVESRIVTGFIAIEFDETAGHYIVRESNAHAWVEVRTGPLSWTAVDATPEDSLRELQEQNRSFADNFRWLYGAVEFLWNSRVVSYDASTQAAIADKLQTGWRDTVGGWFDRIGDRLSAIATMFSLGQAGRAWFAAIAVAVLAGALVPLAIAIRRGRIRRALRLGGLSRERRRVLLRDGSTYAAALAELARAGFPKPDHATPIEHARALTEQNPEAGRVFAAIAEDYYRVRFGGLAIQAGGAGEKDSRIFALRQALLQNRRLRTAD